MRLIDADALISEMAKQWENNDLTNNDWCFIRTVINCTPTAVVRCKDCKAWSRYGDTVIGYCDLSGINWHDNDFCCYGERKEDE